MTYCEESVSKFPSTLESLAKPTDSVIVVKKSLTLTAMQCVKKKNI